MTDPHNHDQTSISPLVSLVTVPIASDLSDFVRTATNAIRITARGLLLASRFITWLRAMASIAARPRSIRAAFIWLLVLIISSQQTLVLAIPGEPVHSSRPNQTFSAPSSPSWISATFATLIDSTGSALNAAATLARDVFYLVLPFDEEVAQPQPASRQWTAADARSRLTDQASGIADRSALIIGAPSFDTVLASLVTEPSAFFLQSSSSISTSAISRQTPNLNNGRIQGNLRVFEGATFNINSGFVLTSDLYTVGTPDIRLNGGASHGGIVNDGGSATPSGYNLNLNNVSLPGKIHIRADAIPLPADIPSNVPSS
ncbi:MAG TPA: hypothetical protein VFV34_25550, partial [Blastocatellia bacterium]|nr:hypothetical protein [Blastocatellia bacterium]